MEKETLARPYAKAIFLMAQAHQDFAAWSTFLAAASEVMRSPEMVAYLSDPLHSDDEKVLSITALCANFSTPYTENLLRTLALYRRLNLLPVMAALFAAYREEYEKKVTVEVSSVVDLTDAQQQRLIQALQNRLHRQVELKYQKDADLLGGLVIRAGDLVIDGSVKNQLMRLEESLVSV